MLDDDHEMISWGYSNITPWHSHREMTEEQLAAAIADMAGAARRHPERAVFNVHVPPFGSGLDEAPVLDENLTVQTSPGQVKFAPVGSTAVRDALLEVQPLLGLHGHIHESGGIRRLGRTIAINPGSRLRDRRRSTARSSRSSGTRSPPTSSSGADDGGAGPDGRGSDCSSPSTSGTSGARAAAFDLDGRRLPRGPPGLSDPIARGPGWAEQDARAWRSAAVGALADLVRRLAPTASGGPATSGRSG